MFFYLSQSDVLRGNFQKCLSNVNSEIDYDFLFPVLFRISHLFEKNKGEFSLFYVVDLFHKNANYTN
jgi:hypothetical protein